jgi:molybdate transport system ATP-binding protein
MTALRFDATVAVGSFTVEASFDADPGITALFGPSGSGKSVTLAAIAGLLRPATGTITLDGATVADAAAGVHVPTQQRHLGMVFQHPALLPHRTPLDNVALAAHGVNRSERRHQAQGWLDRVHAAHLSTAATPTLSGGEQQRVALARALVGRPRLLLLDEPFSALDQPTRASLRRLVRELVDEHAITAVLVTHDLEDITSLADRVVLYEPGRTISVHDLRAGERPGIAALLGLGPDRWGGP